MKRFDSVALFKALDEQRVARDLTWSDIAKEIGVASATMTRLRAGGRLEVDGMLAMVSWLGVTVETFVRDEPR
jgi:transcriptional regulator with XRE-family HTH domain